jgi:hypothetical protein
VTCASSHIHDGDKAKARKTLRHEPIDHRISRRAVEPPREYTSVQKDFIKSLDLQAKKENRGRINQISVT